MQKRQPLDHSIDRVTPQSAIVAFCPIVDSREVAELLLLTDDHLRIQHFLTAYELLTSTREPYKKL